MVNLIDTKDFLIVADSAVDGTPDERAFPSLAGLKGSIVHSLCSHVALRTDGSPMVINDTLEDWRFHGYARPVEVARRVAL
jgi:hypothetical protein